MSNRSSRGKSVKLTPFEWQRGSRSSFSLGVEVGVYALFLRNGALLPGIELSRDGLIYVGLAANRNGLKGRCHFNARTRNHSPRKSLAVLLMEELSLSPVLINKPNSSDTWGLDVPSDARLSAWMHANLELAIEICSDPDSRETELVAQYAPPLNLTKCVQTSKHRRISKARANVMAELQGRQRVAVSNNPGLKHRPTKLNSALTNDAARPVQQVSHLALPFVGADIETAEAIAARHGVNPKRYRQRLRDSIPWYRKPQYWSFPKDTSEWRDMIVVAKKMQVGG